MVSIPSAVRLVAAVLVLCVALRASEPYTIIVLPDTQFYSAQFPEIFEAQTQWIADNAEERNIVFVLHEGDITDHNAPAEWQNALDAMSLLDGVVPYAVLPGNHDMGTNGTADVRDTTLFNTYFPTSAYDSLPTFGGTYTPGLLDNSYHLFETFDTEWLVLALEFAPRDDVLTWASSVLGQHPERRAIVVTHAHVYSDDTLHGSSPSHVSQPGIYGIALDPAGANDGVAIWDTLRQHENVQFVFSGHVPNDGTGLLVSSGDAGNTVYQMLANYQFPVLPTAGDGYLRILEFDPGHATVDVQTYSPWLDAYLTAPDQEFGFSDVGFGPVSTGTHCQVSLGYQSAGADLTLGICGDDLTTDESIADLSITGAPPLTPVFLFVGLSNNPTPLQGGTLVPFPYLMLLDGLVSNPAGELLFPVRGDDGAITLTLYLQAAMRIGPQTYLSNALELVIGI